MNDIQGWLERHGFGQFADLFDENEIDLDVLPELDEEDLKALGLSLGARKKLLKAIRELDSEDVAHPPQENPAPVVPGRTGEAERRQLTVMFCDLAGSTALSHTMDAEDYRELLGAFQTAAVRAIEDNGGYVARYMGDGLLVYFGYPVAGEDDPERAARAGLDVVTSVAGLDSAMDLEVRVGIATGAVVVGDIIGEGASEEAAVLGETPNLAARLQGVAAPNTVLLSPTTQALVSARIHTEPLPPVALKGLSRPVIPYRALRPRSLSEVSETLRDSTPLVGREVDMALLHRAWRHAESGEGQAVLISSEAGVGKSRLLRAFRGELAKDSFRPVQWHCSPYHRTTANYPGVEQLRRTLNARMQGADDPVSALASMIDDLGLDVNALLPGLATLLSIPLGTRFSDAPVSPDVLKRQLIRTQTDLLLAAARQVPVLFLIEDLHWSDPTTLEVLTEMVGAIRDARVLMLMTARPEFVPPWVRHSQTITHSLGSLSRSETMTLARGLIDASELSAQAIEQIAERTDGIPLFVEELTKSLLESNADSEIPVSLQDSLMARLDRLGSTKGLAQVASVIGRSFSLDTLLSITDERKDRVSAGLQSLVQAGLIHRRRDAEYEFKHALVRDAAYSTLTRKRRKSVHAAVANQLIREYEVSPDSIVPELIAHHLMESDSVQRALEYLEAAGDRALLRGAQPEAAAHFCQALDLFPVLEPENRDKRKELSVLLRAGFAQFGAIGGAAPATMEIFRRAIELSMECGSVVDECRALYGRWVGLSISGRIADALELSHRVAAIAHSSGESWMGPLAARLSGTPLFLQGRISQARTDLTEALRLEEFTASLPAFAHNPVLTTPPTLALVEWALGYPDTALRRSESVISRASTDPNSRAYVLVWHMILSLLRREPDRAKEAARQTEAHTDLSGGRFWSHMAVWGRGGADVLTGDRGGVTAIKKGLSGYTATGARQMVPFPILLLAEGALLAEDGEECDSLLDDAEHLIADTEQFIFQPELLRLRGEALRAQGDVRAATRALQSAMTLAREQDSRSFELRAALSLGDVLLEEGRPLDASRMLRPLYDGFTEGFDTPDLIRARSLLERLA